jgi:hypothetical protein
VALGYRRQNRNVVFRSALEPVNGGGSVWLVCRCGGRVLVEDVALMLIATNKT